MIIYRQFEKTYADDIYKLQNEWVKEALIKSGVQITPSDFLSEKCKICAGILPDFKQFLCDMAENMQVSCASKPML